MKKYFGLILVILSVTVGRSQISISPNSSFAACPGTALYYQANNTVTNSCIFDWTVINGSIQGGFQSGNISTFSGGNLVTVTWLNVTSGGQIKVATRNCSSDKGNLQGPTFNYAILSINGVNPGAISGKSGVTANVTDNQTYTIPQINFPNIGSGDVTPKEVSSYEWEIPAGWSVVSGGSTKSITVKPDNCSGGTIRVRGKNTLCANGPFYSNWSTPLTITRTLNTPAAITSSTGKTTVVCNDKTPIAFSVPVVAGATAYTWAAPSGWAGASTTNTINLTPSGTTAGDVSVKATGCTVQSAASSLSMQLQAFNPVSPPAISGVSDAVCSSATYSLLNQPPLTSYSWISSDPVYFPINTATGGAVRQSGFNGVVSVTVAISGGCGSYNVSKSVIVGTGIADPLITQKSIYCLDPYQYSILASVTPAPGVATYRWYIDNVLKNTTIWASGMSVPGGSVDNRYHRLRVDITNSCNTVSTASAEGQYKATCGGTGTLSLSIYPSPASSQLTVEYLPGEKSVTSPANSNLADEVPEEFNVRLVDAFGKEKKSAMSKNHTVTLDVRDLPRGIHFLHIHVGGKIIVRQIQINN